MLYKKDSKGKEKVYDDGLYCNYCCFVEWLLAIVFSASSINRLSLSFESIVILKNLMCVRRGQTSTTIGISIS